MIEASGTLVLLVEDETFVRMVASEMLQEEGGFNVHEAGDGKEALSILEECGHAVCALVSDISMPRLNGLELATIVKERWPHIGIVLASGYPPSDIRQRMPDGARFLRKPYSERELLNGVRAVIVRPQLRAAHRPSQAGPGHAVPFHNYPLLYAGRLHGSGGLAQPLTAPDK